LDFACAVQPFLKQIYSYQSFLNSLEFPIQILVKSRKLDIDAYLENMTTLARDQKDQRLQAQTFEYIEYIGKLVELADIMEKRFYVIVPHDPTRTGRVNPISKFIKALNPADSVENIKLREKEFESMQKGINQRASSVRSGLIRCSLNVKRLNTYELINLLYQSYNPKTAYNQKAENLSKLNIEAPQSTEEDERNSED